MELKEKIAGLNEKGCTLTIQRHAVLEYLYENRPTGGHFGEMAVNLLTNDALDSVARIPEFKVCAVAIERV